MPGRVLIDALRQSETLARYGARLEAGVLFQGPPGTGKTLVARYVATVSGALFVNAREFPREDRAGVSAHPTASGPPSLASMPPA